MTRAWARLNRRLFGKSKKELQREIDQLRKIDDSNIRARGEAKTALRELHKVIIRHDLISLLPEGLNDKVWTIRNEISIGCISADRIASSSITAEKLADAVDRPRS